MRIDSRAVRRPARAPIQTAALLAALLLTATAFLAVPATLQAARPSLRSTRATHLTSHTPTRPAPKRPPTVTATLQALQRTSQITPTEYTHYAGAYAAATASAKRLTGTRRTELEGVLTNVQAMATAGDFIPSRLPVIFLTVERNREWWTTKYLPAAKSRVSFPGSRLVWEYYPGQGIEIQWLGTFGEANGYYGANNNTALTEVLNEAAALATKRAGGIAWEYMFQFDGGLPPWTSGLSQGTALQAFSRGWVRSHNQAYLTTAQQALGIFQHAPPEGVRVATPAGAEYAEYTYAPNLHILNGFIQADIGLYDYTEITKDPLGEQLFEAGDAEARVETPHYDTGGWSLYDQYEESDLSYHELLTEFLEHLCQRTKAGTPLAVAAATPTPGTSTGSTTGSSTGGGTAPAAGTAPKPTPIAGDEIYCTVGEHFRADLHDPPTIELLSTTLQGGARAGVQFSLNKVATVSMTISQGGKTVWSNRATVEGGKPKLLWMTPSQGGVYEVKLSATDLAGNSESTTGTIAVSAAPTPSKKPAAKKKSG